MTPAASDRAPALRRPADGRLIAGVAAGLAEHLDVNVLHVRVVLVLLSAVNGFGALLYAVLWVAVSTGAAQDEPAGLAAASRAGRRSRLVVRRGDVGQLVALGTLGLGLVLLLTTASWGVPLAVTVPLLIASAGIALLWTQADATERAWFGRAGASVGAGQRRWLTALRLGGGSVLVVLALMTFVIGSGRTAQLGQAVALLLVIALGLGLAAGPLVWRLLRQLDQERQERSLQQQQADLAAHLHDSVLQTLALIQRKADDPRAVLTLARAQERDLRGWLFDQVPEGASRLRAALDATAAEVEQAHGVPVEVVVVGDCEMDDRLDAMARAAREAMVNAAKHSGASAVDVYAECLDDVVEVFVRDRGQGFDPQSVPADRMGLRGSVVGRMERHGGTARVRSASGEGAEVALTMSRHGPSNKECP